MPSYHVCSTCVLPAPPHVPNQEPPRPQQLILPDLRIVTHAAQTELMAFVVPDTFSHVESWRSNAERGKHSTYTNTAHRVHFPLTCADLQAIRPCMTKHVSVVAGTSTALVPGTTRSATTGLARFLEGAARDTCLHRDDWRTDRCRVCCPDYEFSIR